jgi:hypothetical protein
MADNTTLDPGTGGDVYRSKDRSGVKTTIVQIDVQDGSGGESVANGGLPITVAAGKEVDGHSATLGATTDADTATTGIGLWKKIKALLAGGLPAALAAGGGLKVEGVAGGVAQPVSETPASSGGADVVNSTSSDGGTALTSTVQAIKASAGSLKGWYIYNPNTAAAFVQFYNTASGSVTVGTTNPLFMVTVPPGSATNVAFPGGIAFGTAMSWAATSTAGGNGAPTTALDAVAFYK